MSISERDKKILMLLLPIALIAAYWFLVYSPKKEESAAIQEKLEQAHGARVATGSGGAGGVPWPVPRYASITFGSFWMSRGSPSAILRP